MRSSSRQATLPEAVAQWIAEHHLLSEQDAVLVAVSGGPDSVALLRLLEFLPPRFHLAITVAHVHHGVRGLSADHDQQFVEELARELGYPCVTERLASETGARDEASLREQRYAALLQLARRVEAPVIAVGHTLDDQVETVLMRIARGTGVEGLCGIPVARAFTERRLVRPLRGVWRDDIEAWLRAIKQPWRIDETNAAPTILRNRIRHALLPLLRDGYNPQIKQALAHLADTAGAQARYLALAGEAWVMTHGVASSDRALLPLQLLCAEPPALQQAILRECLRRLQGHLQLFTYQHWLELEALLTNRPADAVVDLPGQLQVRKELEYVVMSRAASRERLARVEETPLVSHPS